MYKLEIKAKSSVSTYSKALRRSTFWNSNIRFYVLEGNKSKYNFHLSMVLWDRSGREDIKKAHHYSETIGCPSLCKDGAF